MSPNDLVVSSNDGDIGSSSGSIWINLFLCISLLGSLLVMYYYYCMRCRRTKIKIELSQLPVLFVISALALCFINLAALSCSKDVSNPLEKWNIRLDPSKGSTKGESLDKKNSMEIQELKQQVESLTSQLHTCQRSQKRRRGEAKYESSSSSTSSTKTSASISSYCALLPQPIPSTIGFWNSYLDSIVEASQHSLDKRWTLHDFTAELLHLLSPDRLARSSMSLPHDWTPVQRALQVLHQRHVYLTQLSSSTETTENTYSNQTNPQEARKLKILVLGGSLIVGVNCRKIVADNNLNMLMPNRLCTWTHRLESFLNKILGGPYVEVQKVALGGTNTQTGYVMWDSDFLPEEAKNPDIVINAYSTNDMHILTVLQAREGNQTLRDKVMEMTQDFVRSILQDGSCSPLLIHVDDYLGNEQREILVTTELAQATMVLANYYGFTSVSYANVVRDIVYGDTHEYWISPQGWYESEQSNDMLREIHPGMGMHIISTWVLAYNLLHLTLSFCAIEPFWNASISANVSKLETPRKYSARHGLPRLHGNPIIPGKPKPRPKGLPPPLEQGLSLENITSLWNSAEPVAEVCPEVLTDYSNSIATIQQRCPFSWFSGLSKQGLNESYAHGLFSTSNPFVEENTGWDINTQGKKLGISPIAGAERPSLRLGFNGYPLSTITLFYMRSYGEKWENSTMSISLTIDDIYWKTEEIVGIHEKQTSETYTHRISLPVQQATKAEIFTHPLSKVQLTLQLTGGQTFKIMGLAICK
jgi:lysophospholipase L1-like esterase